MKEATNTNFYAAYSRMVEVTGLLTQVDMAEFLNVRQSSISDAKKRNTVPEGWLVKILRKTGVNPDWIISGQGSKYLVPSENMPVVEVQEKGLAEFTSGELFEEFKARFSGSYVSIFIGTEPDTSFKRMVNP